MIARCDRLHVYITERKLKGALRRVHFLLVFFQVHGPVRSCAAVVKPISIESLLRAGSRDSQADCLPTFFCRFVRYKTENGRSANARRQRPRAIIGRHRGPARHPASASPVCGAGSLYLTTLGRDYRTPSRPRRVIRRRRAPFVPHRLCAVRVIYTLRR